MAIFGDEAKILREWAPLTDLFNKLPARTQNGIFNQEVQLTCVDVLPEFIALGTNIGVVYWYNRKKKDLQRLRCENTSSPITVLRIISTVDYMLACGNAAGNVNIFQIPKSHPENLPEKLRPKNKQVERYSVSDMHKGAISALEWSKNGMKLFSGDKNGLVVLTEIDFYMHICKSVEILNETYEVVQLSYHQQNLLISTTYRSIVCQKQDKWKISQVGKKDRKTLGKFGGIFYNNGVRPNDMHLYCTRPGLRIWQSDISGNVQQTLLFKDIISKEYPEASLINPISNHLKRQKPFKEPSFGTLLIFQDELLVTYGSDVVYVLNPKDLTILHTVSNLRGILCVACNKDEIFILEEDRSLIRLAYQPETANQESYSTSTVNTFTPISSSFKEFTSKLQSSNVVPAIPPLAESPENIFNIHTDVTSIVNAEEATESPQFQNYLESNENKILNTLRKNNKMEIYKKIAQEDFDDSIIFKHHKHKKPVEMATSVNSLSSASSDEHDNSSITKATVMNLSTVTILPDLRSPDSILNDIEQKEKLLADVLNFDKIKINPENLKEVDTPKITSAVENIVTKYNEFTNNLHVKESPKSEAVSTNAENGETSKDIKHNEYVATSTNTGGDCFYYIKDDNDPSKVNNSTKNAANSYFFNNKHNDLINMSDTLSTENPGTTFFCYFKNVGDSKPNGLSADSPDVRVIPNEWNLSSVQITKEHRTSESDNSLGDWEII